MSAHYALLCTTTYTNLYKFTVLYAMLSAAVSDCQSQVGIWNIYDAIYKVKCIKAEALKDRRKILPWRQGTQGRRQTKEKFWVREKCDAVAVTWWKPLWGNGKCTCLNSIPLFHTLWYYEDTVFVDHFIMRTVGQLLQFNFHSIFQNRLTGLLSVLGQYCNCGSLDSIFTQPIQVVFYLPLYQKQYSNCKEQYLRMRQFWVNLSTKIHTFANCIVGIVIGCLMLETWDNRRFYCQRQLKS